MVLSRNVIGGCGGGGVENIWLDASSFQSRYGTPTFTELVGVGGIGGRGISAWALDAATLEVVSTNVRIPEGVASVVLDFVFAMVSAVAGDIFAGFVTNSMAIGESAANNSSALAPDIVVISVPGVAQEIKSQTIVPSITISAGDILGINARRTGGDAKDTAAGDCLFLGCDCVFT